MKLSYYTCPGRRLGHGSFGSVFEAKAANKGSILPAALKRSHVTNYIEHPHLLHEACALILLKGHPNIPDVFAWGRSQYYEYLATELLQDNLDNVFDERRRPLLNMRNVVRITCQMLSVIEHVHSRGIVHCDIKPGNFAFGRGDNSGRVYLIDYGLCKPYRDLQSSRHLPDMLTKRLRGTPAYASINAHLHRSPSRRDDMESLAYTIIFLLTNRLPWYDYDEDDHILIAKSKQSWSGAELCRGYPPVFGEFVDYARGLSFAESPDYGPWRDRFRELVPHLPKDPLYDPSDVLGGPVGAHEYISDAMIENKLELKTPPLSTATQKLPTSNHGFRPMSSRQNTAGSLEVSDMLGDELHIVRRYLEPIEDVPEWLDREDGSHGIKPEVMTTY